MPFNIFPKKSTRIAHKNLSNNHSKKHSVCIVVEFSIYLNNRWHHLVMKKKVCIAKWCSLYIYKNLKLRKDDSFYYFYISKIVLWILKQLRRAIVCFIKLSCLSVFRIYIGTNATTLFTNLLLLKRKLYESIRRSLSLIIIQQFHLIC